MTASDPRSRLREALAEAVAKEVVVSGQTVTDISGFLPFADAVLAVLPEHRDDVLALLGPTKAQRHQEHYRTCDCLGDSDVCCDPLCCAEPDRLSPKGRFGPTPVGHPSIGDPCRLCGGAIEEGQVPSLVTLGPADDEEATKADAGRAYNAVAAVVHEACAYPEPNHWRDDGA